MNHRRILKFIKSVRESIAGAGAVYIYTHGSCYQFHLMLKSVLPEAIPYYNSNHVITRIGERFYDITGEVKDTTDFLNMQEHYNVDLKSVKMRVEFFDESIMKKMRKMQKINN